ncbi:MAG: TonB-dependent receptor [Bacteroidales bacterium]|nr:TonB-dependent receptor [Bacteroidales bacterium]
MKRFSLIVLCLLTGSIFAQQQNDTIKTIVLDEFTVSSTRLGNKSLSQEKVNKATLTRQNSGENLPFILTTTPSLVATSEDGLGIGGTSFRLRGSDATRINVTINSVPLNDAESHSVFWYNMTDLASSLNSVVIQRGVGSSTNGAASFGGSLNMQSNVLPSALYGELSLNAGMFNTFRESVAFGTPLGKGFSVDARFTKTNSDGYIERSASDLYSYQTALGWANNKTIVKLLAFGGGEKTQMAWDGISEEQLKINRRYNPAGAYYDPFAPFGESYYENQTDNYQQNHFHLFASHAVSNRWDINATLHYTHGFGYYEQYKADAKLKKYFDPAMLINTSAKSDLIRQKYLDNDFGGGVISANYNSSKFHASIGGAANYYSGLHYGQLQWLKTDSLIQPDVYHSGYEYYHNIGTKTDANVYAKALWNITKGLSVYGDLQYRFINYQINGTNDDDDQLRNLNINENFNFVNPKAGITYETDGHTVYGSFAIANREPNRKNYTEGVYQDENGELQNMPKAERLFDYELGYNFANRWITAGLNGFWMQYKDQLVATGEISETGSLLTENVAKSYRAGVELLFGVKFCSWLRLDVNATISTNKINEFTAKVEVYDEDFNWLDENVPVEYKNTDIAYSPNIVAGSSVTFERNQFSAMLQTNYVGKQFIDNTARDNASLPAYCISNLIFNYSLPVKTLKTIDFSLRFNNLFNTEYCSNGYSYWTYQLGNEMMTDMRYFPQAGFNVMGGITVKF